MTEELPNLITSWILTPAARASFTRYILLPKRFSFAKRVRILADCQKFVEAFKRKWRKTKSYAHSPPLHLQSFALSDMYQYH